MIVGVWAVLAAPVLGREAMDEDERRKLPGEGVEYSGRESYVYKRVLSNISIIS
jgi:hypothetical protein